MTKLLSFFFLALFSTAFSNTWSQKTLEQMSLDEKIGQLFMIAGFIDSDFAIRETENPRILEEIDTYITKYCVGGIGFVGPSTSAKQVEVINRYQKMSKYPLLIAQDFEWGLSMRLTDGMRFPKNITLGVLQDDSLIYQMGKEIGRQGKLVGVHMNFSPDMDVNIEPENPVINVRSFGASPQNVAKKGIAMIRGLQDAGMIASTKHFPGLGDITVDPHLDLPTNLQGRKRLEEVELYPFEQAIQAGVLSIQTDHVSFPALEPDPALPSSLSQKIVQELLKEKMGFQGLVISGALRMKALAKHFSQEEIAVKAFLAGSDMLLMPAQLPQAYQAIKEAVQEGKISLVEIDKRVLKILQLKERSKLDQSRVIPVPTQDELHTPEAKALKRTLYQQAVSLQRNDQNLVPLRQKEGALYAYVQIGEPRENVYYEALQKKMHLEPFFIPLEVDEEAAASLLQKLEKYPVVILTVYPLDPRRIAQIRLLNPQKQAEELANFRVHGIPKATANLLDAFVGIRKKTVVSFFGNPFALDFFKGFSTFIMGYEDDPDAQIAAASLVF